MVPYVPAPSLHMISGEKHVVRLERSRSRSELKAKQAMQRCEERGGNVCAGGGNVEVVHTNCKLQLWVGLGIIVF